MVVNICPALILGIGGAMGETAGIGGTGRRELRDWTPFVAASRASLGAGR